MAKDRNDKNREFKIPDDAKRLAKLTFKKFKKDSGDFYDSKKELKKAYFAQICDYLPESIQVIVRYGHLTQMKETKEAIYSKLTDPEFIKYLTKEITKNDVQFDNMELIPFIIYDILTVAAKTKAMDEAENPGTTVTFELDDLINLSHVILKKKIKKMNKEGIPEKLAFDVLSVLPHTNILKRSQYFHIRQLFNVIYEHAKMEKIEFDKLMKVLLKNDESYIASILTFSLLERKEKISSFNEGQRDAFNSITEYTFKTLEDMKRDEINAILKAYATSRKRDESQNKDTNRRFYISTLPESDYPKILKEVEKICDRDESLKKYF